MLDVLKTGRPADIGGYRSSGDGSRSVENGSGEYDSTSFSVSLSFSENLDFQRSRCVV